MITTQQIQEFLDETENLWGRLGKYGEQRTTVWMSSQSKVEAIESTGEVFTPFTAQDIEKNLNSLNEIVNDKKELQDFMDSICEASYEDISIDEILENIEE